MTKGLPKTKYKIYAVRKGFKPGIYNTWEECKSQVHRFHGAEFKSFNNLTEAQNYMKIKPIHKNKILLKVCGENKEDKELNQQNESYAYIDGSFNNKTKIYGYGGFIMHKGQKYIIKGNGKDENYAKMRNVAGEVLASQKVIEKAISLGIKNIDIYYDYEGIEKWATGEWKRNEKETQNYYDFYQSIKSKINVNFIKVKGHSGNEGNDEADTISKEAAGIYQIKPYKF